MRAQLNSLTFWITLALTLLPLSCRSRFRATYPVSGQVLYEGKPTPGARVYFSYLTAPDDPIAKPMATVDEEGRFRLSTYRKDDGAPAGDYAVTIVWLPPGYQGPIEKANKLPARYADPATSELKVTVEPQNNELAPFSLTK